MREGRLAHPQVVDEKRGVFYSTCFASKPNKTALGFILVLEHVIGIFLVMYLKAPKTT